MTGLTSHVLDTTQGMPGRGIHVQLWKLSSAQPVLISEQHTNSDGRCVMTSELEEAEYELRFDIGLYFKAQQQNTSEKKPFLNIVPVRFYVADTKQHYHVPLIVTPWAYSTYRGS